MQPQKNNVAQPSNVLIDARTYTQDASGKGVVLGTEDTSWLNGRAQQNQGSLRPMSGGVDAPPPQGAQAAMNEQLQNLFSGENLSEDFMGKASIVFEAALNERTEAIRQSVLSESAALVEQEVGNAVNELATRLDEYLSYAVDEWMKENKLAVESGIRTEISESFINGLKSLFETHYIEVPESKQDILEDLFSDNQELETSLNEQIQTNMRIKQELEQTAARGIFMEAVSDLTQVDAERLASLANSISYTSPQEFHNKLVVLKENYLKAAPVAAREPETLTEQRIAPRGNDPMSAYVNVLGRLSH
tara:strand:- start:3387 stop:4301 length:915 start_codon:yes stop_codon:yes gene_type:complete